MQDSKNIELMFQNLLLHAQFKVNMVTSYKYCFRSVTSLHILSGNMSMRYMGPSGQLCNKNVTFLMFFGPTKVR